MLQSGEKETEILLGNKQLLGVFFVAAALLGIAFTGGYMAGRGSAKRAASAEPSAAEAARSETGTGGQTHTVSQFRFGNPTCCRSQSGRIWPRRGDALGGGRRLRSGN